MQRLVNVLVADAGLLQRCHSLAEANWVELLANVELSGLER